MFYAKQIFAEKSRGLVFVSSEDFRFHINTGNASSLNLIRYDELFGSLGFFSCLCCETPTHRVSP